MAFYRALRFIRRRDFKPTDPGGVYLPWKIYSPAPQTWISWEEGNKFREMLSHQIGCFNKKEKGFRFRLSDLKALHKQVISKNITGAGDKLFFTKGLYPNPGEFRNKGHLTSGFFVKKSWKYGRKEKKEIKSFEELGTNGKSLITSTLVRLPGTKYYRGRVKYVESKNVPKEMKAFFQELNSDTNNFFKSSKTLRAPIELVADAQRKYVAIHPFHEGNGRMSRYLQDILLEFIGLPYTLSGDLQEDIVNTKNNYRKQTYHAYDRLLKDLGDCLKQYKSGRKMNGYCRPIYIPTKGDSTLVKNQKEKFNNNLRPRLEKINKIFPKFCK